jgi:hypothetical protein
MQRRGPLGDDVPTDDSLQQLVERNRQVSDADAGRVEHRAGDRRRGATMPLEPNGLVYGSTSSYQCISVEPNSPTQRAGREIHSQQT